MKKILLTLALLVGLTSSAFAFATGMNMIQGGEKINFTSNIDGVSVYMNGQKQGILRHNNFVCPITRDGLAKEFTFKKAGYKDVTLQMTKNLDAIFWANFIVGGSVGSSIDSLSTKNAYSYTPDYYFIDMEKE
eukprot:COSAG01_NODE_9_length_43729_cov_66.133463_20_plen_133_part_00